MNEPIRIQAPPENSLSRIVLVRAKQKPVMFAVAGIILFPFFFIVLTSKSITFTDMLPLLIPPVVAIVAILVFINIKISKHKSSGGELHEDRDILLFDDAIRFPSYLIRDPKQRPEASFIKFPNEQILDFEIIPASGSRRNPTPRHFRMEVGPRHEQSRAFQILSTISQVEEEKIVAHLKDKLAHKGEHSPFSVTAKELRAGKAKVWGIVAGISLTGLVAITMKFVFFPPVYIFAALLQLTLLSLVMGFALAIGLQSTRAMEKFFKPGPGQEMTLTGLSFASCTLSGSFLILLNIYGPQVETWKADIDVNRVSTTKHKNSRSYDAHLKIHPRIGKQFFHFDESTSFSISRAEFENFAPGTGHIVVESSMGILGIPYVKNYQYISTARSLR